MPHANKVMLCAVGRLKFILIGMYSAHNICLYPNNSFACVTISTASGNLGLITHANGRGRLEYNFNSCGDNEHTTNLHRYSDNIHWVRYDRLPSLLVESWGNRGSPEELSKRDKHKVVAVMPSGTQSELIPMKKSDFKC